MNASLLDSVDWSRYEERAFAAVEDAVRHYGRRRFGSCGKRIAQVAVSTHLSSRITEIAFESLEALCGKGGIFVNDPPADTSPVIEVPCLADLGDFDMRHYHAVYHPEVLPLARLDFNDPEQRGLVLAYTERFLLRVRDRVVAEGVLDPLPREGPIWIGINSPERWYDHVTRYPASRFERP